MAKSYFRPAIDAIAGYTPGEQPKMQDLIKLNTNENPYPPAPGVARVLREADIDKLRRYPDPCADGLRDMVAERFGFSRDNVIAVNGSDDLLTIVFRAFCDREHPLAVLDPTYSLYQVLAAMQEAPVQKIPLDTANDFAMPDAATILAGAAGASLLIITRPNAPTGNSCPLATLREVAAGFEGILLIDEAYADFAPDNAIELVREFDNCIVSRTFSKSYSLAAGRIGFALAPAEVIYGLMKLKDSYNVDMLTQLIAQAAFADTEYLQNNVRKIIAGRERLAAALKDLGCRVIKSDANFLFASPPGGDGGRWFRELRERAVIVRYFPGEITGAWCRITVGTEEEIDKVISTSEEIFSNFA